VRPHRQMLKRTATSLRRARSIDRHHNLSDSNASTRNV